MRDWRGPTGFVLACCVGLSFLAAMIAVSFFQTEAISAEGAGLLNTLGGAIVGGVVVWLGGFGSQSSPRDDLDYHPPQHRKERIMTTTPERPDPALDPDRELDTQPQDVVGEAEPDEDEGTDAQPRR